MQNDSNNEEVKTPTEEVPSTPAPEQKIPIHIRIHEESKTQINASSEKIIEGIISDMVSAEVINRKNHLRKALEIRTLLEASVKKHKPDDVKFDDKGNQVSAFWTKIAIEAKNRDAKKLETLDNAIEKAISHNEWDNLVKVIGQVSNNGNNAKPE